MHGEDAILEEVLDWRPPPRYVTGIKSMPGGLSLVYTDEVLPVDGGCEVNTRMKPRRAEDRDALVAAATQLDQPVELGFQKLAALLDEEIRRRETIAEAQLPTADEEGRLASSVRGA